MNDTETLHSILELFQDMIECKLLSQQMLSDTEREFQKDPASVDPTEMWRAVQAYHKQENRPERWMEQFELSDQEVDEMQDAKFIIFALVISGQLTVIAAKPGSGKTSVAMHEVCTAVEAGYRVVYVNMDCGAADVKYWHRLAKAGGFKMITPHFSGADGVNAWLDGLAHMASGDHDLSDLLIVIDTLKKIGDLMNKTRMKVTMNLLRALTAKGATVVCLAHCNKHRDAAGKLVFEGVGDVESDCDNLIYLESEKGPDGIRTVSTEPSDKVRGIFTPRSWKIHPDRTVEALESFIDVKATTEAILQRDKDETAIEVIQAGIRAGKHKRVELLDYTTEHKISKREFDSVIKRYCQGQTDAKTVALWRNEKQFQHNENFYILLEVDA
jgi:hypothetical protein